MCPICGGCWSRGVRRGRRRGCWSARPPATPSGSPTTPWTPGASRGCCGGRASSAGPARRTLGWCWRRRWGCGRDRRSPRWSTSHGRRPRRPGWSSCAWSPPSCSVRRCCAPPQRRRRSPPPRCWSASSRCGRRAGGCWRWGCGPAADRRRRWPGCGGLAVTWPPSWAWTRGRRSWSSRTPSWASGWRCWIGRSGVTRPPPTRLGLVPGRLPRRPGPPRRARCSSAARPSSPPWRRPPAPSAAAGRGSCW